MHAYLKDRCHVFMTVVIFTGRPLSRYRDSCAILNSIVLLPSLALLVVVSWQWLVVMILRQYWECYLILIRITALIVIVNTETQIAIVVVVIVARTNCAITHSLFNYT